MADRGKVIKGLEICIRVQDNEKCPDECPYRKDICYGTVGLMADALSLLKEQETRYIDKGEDVILETGDIVRRWQCENCGDHILARFDSKPKFKYCSNCGRAVKWE